VGTAESPGLFLKNQFLFFSANFLFFPATNPGLASAMVPLPLVSLFLVSYCI
jgi:hypothetical protein